MECSKNSIFGLKPIRTGLFGWNCASELGSNTAQAAARYDYIIGKYGTENYEDFMSRNPSPINKGAFINTTSNSENGYMSIVIVSVLITTLSLSLYFVLRKRR